jgi:hypothetical protein
MKAIARSLVIVLVALIAVPALVVSTAITSAVQLLAAVTGFYMGGTQHPLSIPPDTAQFITDYMNLADKNYIVPAADVAPGTRIPVVYPAQVAPFSPFLSTSTLDNSVLVGRNNLDSCLRGGPCNGGSAVTRQPGDTFDVYGYSLSAIVAALAKRDLIDDPGTAPADTNFFLIANPMRPNGGILARGFEGMTIPFVGITFYGPAPTNSCDVGDCLDTVDVAQQYDFLGGDAPARLDPLAFANSLAAYALLHGNMPNRTIDGTDPEVIFQDEYGDTTYYMVTAPRLPLLMIVEQAGVPGPLLALPDALLRVWIEDKYRRDLSPGEHVQFELSPIGNPINLVGNMLGAIPVGIDDTVQQASGANSTLRPLGTADVYRPFGVGGQAYDKTTGQPVDDNIGLPTGAGDYDAQTSVQTAGASQREDTKLAEDQKTEEVVNGDETDGASTPEVTRPRPLQMIRESLNFDPTKRPATTRPSGDGPLKRIVNSLTGQRPQPAAAGDAPASDAA